MRCRYLKAVLRQDVEYFDLHVTSTSEIITSVSSDSLVIQDVLSEKVRCCYNCHQLTKNIKIVQARDFAYNELHVLKPRFRIS